MAKKKVGRPKGSVNKNKVVASTSPLSEANLTKLALISVEQANAIKNLEIAVNILNTQLQTLSGVVNSLEKDTNSVKVSGKESSMTADIDTEALA